MPGVEGEPIDGLDNGLEGIPIPPDEGALGPLPTLGDGGGSPGIPPGWRRLRIGQWRSNWRSWDPRRAPGISTPERTGNSLNGRTLRSNWRQRAPHQHPDHRHQSVLATVSTAGPCGATGAGEPLPVTRTSDTQAHWRQAQRVQIASSRNGTFGVHFRADRCLANIRRLPRNRSPCFGDSRDIGCASRVHDCLNCCGLILDIWIVLDFIDQIVWLYPQCQ